MFNNNSVLVLVIVIIVNTTYVHHLYDTVFTGMIKIFGYDFFISRFFIFGSVSNPNSFNEILCVKIVSLNA